MNNIELLIRKANDIRNDVIAVAVRNGAGHIAPSLSCVDILVALYYEAMNYERANPLWEERDRLIFSKSHGCYALYAILADLGILPRKEWEGFYTAESSLCGCAERRLEYGLEAGCGALGHGLPMAVGLAFGATLQKKTYQTYCLLGDGEFQEGTSWEAIQFAVKHHLSNLTIIVDANGLQAMDFIVNVLDRDHSDLVKRLEGFGLMTRSCYGHDAAALATTLKTLQHNGAPGPRVLIAQTVKGFGLKCMENVPKFHFRLPTAEELAWKKSHE